ncbi:MAG TPA: hypothetical protein VGE24_01065, partial [Emticicia sp.]
RSRSPKRVRIFYLENRFPDSSYYEKLNQNEYELIEIKKKVLIKQIKGYFFNPKNDLKNRNIV